MVEDCQRADWLNPVKSGKKKRSRFIREGFSILSTFANNFLVKT
jgi:hypothetical protein